MFSWFTDLFLPKRRANDLYGAVVAFARTPLFYQDIGVADTPEGRYEILVLHLFLVMERLRSLGVEGERLSQELIDKFVTDIDDNFREMGIGDLSVPRKVKKAAGAFYDRAEVYRAAINGQPKEALMAVFQEFMPITQEYTFDRKALALHVISLNRALKDQSLNSLTQVLNAHL
ncbi:MAG: ubiquinol-cytochrome C chaperone family protein [Hyphomicrobium sp.]